MKPYFLEYACPTGTAATYSTPAPSQRNPDFKPTIHRWLGMQLKGWYGTLWYMYGMVYVWHGMVWRGCDGAPTDLKVVVVALPSCNLPPLRTHSPHRSLGPLLPSFKQSFSISSFDFCVYDLNQQLVKRKTCPDIFFWQSDFTLTNTVAESKIKRPIASNTFFST